MKRSGNETIRVVRTNLWIDPIFDQMLHEAGIQVQVIDVAASPEDWHAALSHAHFYHVSAAKDELPPGLCVTAELLEKCPLLQAVSSSGAGYDTIDVNACAARNISVVNQAGGNANSVAEMALGLLLATARRIVESDRRLIAEDCLSREDLMGHELCGKTLGIVGLGHIGTRFAQLGGALGMRVMAHDPYLGDDEIKARMAQPAPLASLLTQADVISVHCPLSAETRYLFNAETFRAMKPGAIFISTARGGIHHEADLYQALVSGHLSGAGLDVWQTEPPRRDNPLLGLSNVVATFHTAGVSHEGRRNVARMAAQQIQLMAQGKPPLHQVFAPQSIREGKPVTS